MLEFHDTPQDPSHKRLFVASASEAYLPLRRTLANCDTVIYNEKCLSGLVPRPGQELLKPLERHWGGSVH